ncbi:SH3 domain-containing protein [Roseomonas sp. E05]|uniref:SH3 domain-containing protein n=1 Tax=Roseomonas sp. E05 TaxID=3046310 RepID=UPI0024B9A919|nr:SH3 domain-containing protein [Roseomonas sp. E05]MDJ0389172.1 SH3 domain-containing protein [Roseomonas sp. E05]
MRRRQRAKGRAWLCGAGLALLAALAACDDQPARETSEAAEAGPARRAAEAALQATAGGAVAMRGVQVYRQAVGRSSAVCGQVNLQPGGGESLFTLFVAIVTPAEGEGRPTVEQHVATSSTTASRVFVEMVSRCYDGGGPQPGQRPGAPPLMPPVPDRMPQATPAPPAPPPRAEREPMPMPSPSAAAAPQETAAPSPAAGGRRVTLRQNGNVRAHPNGGGMVLRVVEQGFTLRVFAEAPGGWLQVGDTEPWGWLHESLVTP